jgi:hypothetical protein
MGDDKATKTSLGSRIETAEATRNIPKRLILCGICGQCSALSFYSRHFFPGGLWLGRSGCRHTGGQEPQEQTEENDHPEKPVLLDVEHTSLLVLGTDRWKWIKVEM